MAGSIGLSLSQRFDNVTHLPLDGGKLYFYAAGTTTPQNAYQDSALTIPWPNPLTLDSGGNVPQLFFADGSIKFRLANSVGVTQLAADGILVIGASSGGGGGGSVDATTVLATADIKFRYGTGVISGFVRSNGRTIGSATSGATERANADCEPLFEYLWGDNSLAVSGGRGATANADWLANKTIVLPDWRGRVLAGLDDMGNLSAARMNILNSTTLGAIGGVQTETIAQANLPNINWPVTDTHRHFAEASDEGYPGLVGLTNPTNVNATNGAGATVPAVTGTAQNFQNLQSTLTSLTGAGSIVVGSGGSGTPLITIQPTAFITLYIKL